MHVKNSVRKNKEPYNSSGWAILWPIQHKTVLRHELSLGIKIKSFFLGSNLQSYGLII